MPLEGLRHARLQTLHLLQAVGDADPERPRVVESREGAQPLETQREVRHPRRRFLEGRDDFRQLLLGLVAEEPEREMEIVRRHPGDGLGERPEPVDLRGDGPPVRLVQENGDEGARHQPSSLRRSMSSAVWDDCHLIATRSPPKRHRRVSTPAGVAQPM